MHIFIWNLLTVFDWSSSSFDRLFSHSFIIIISKHHFCLFFFFQQHSLHHHHHHLHLHHHHLFSLVWLLIWCYLMPQLESGFKLFLFLLSSLHKVRFSETVEERQTFFEANILKECVCVFIGYWHATKKVTKLSSIERHRLQR